MKKIIAVLFVLCAAVLSIFFIVRMNIPKKNNTVIRSRTVTPIVKNKGESEEAATDIIQDDTSKTTFIPLRSDETLIQSLSVDFNSDGSDDQIIEVKKIGSPYLYLIVGLFNSSKSTYERTAEINTTVVHDQTFSFTCIDIIGNHTMALVYQGFNEKGNSVLRIYQTHKKNNTYILHKIGDFESDDVISIDQKDRSDSYELFQAKGKSFPVWVYSSDSSTNDSLGRIQTKYDWSYADNAYVKKLQYRVPGRKIAAKELAKIQDGTVSSFIRFLSGLWYKTESDGKTPRYLFFDGDSKEIIFLFKDSEEVYSWLNSTLRRNGIYLYSTNTSISNLQRRIDVSLVDVDEVRIRIQDDVRMLIKEGNLWDGNYKKMTAQNQIAAFKQVKKADDFITNLRKMKNWTTSSGSFLTFKNNTYTVKLDSDISGGFFTCFLLGNDAMIQFEKKSGESSISGIYVMTYDSEDSKKKDRIILRPVIISPESYSFDDSRVQLVLEKSNENG